MINFIGSHTTINDGLIDGAKIIRNVGGNAIQIFAPTKKKISKDEKEHFKTYLKKKIKCYV
ncbi:MAG: hypothetical protein CMF62_02215 [Magnetococcales bacterium]|nr:hypothetical protein [Magnetococcales bacterium]